MKKLKQLSCALVAAGMAVAAITSHATTIGIGDQLLITSTSVLGSGGKVSINSGSYFSTTAGAFQLKVVDNAQSGATLTLQSYCTDVGVAWKSGDTYTAKSLADAGNGVKPAWSAGLASISDAAYLYNTFNPIATTAAKAASLQLAIWKVLYDADANGYVADTSFSSGNLKAKFFGGSILTDAVGFINTLNDALTKPGGLGALTDLWLSPNDNKSQGLIYYPGPPSSSDVTTSVPEPSTVIAGALLLLPFGVSAFKIIRRKNAAQS